MVLRTGKSNWSMVKAFVFGKFLPFHKGHEAMIHFAITKCDLLSVLVCCSDKENIPAGTRKKWIEETFSIYQNIEVLTFNYLENEFPNTSVSSFEVSKVWAEKFREFFPDYDLVITSEDYGNYVASFMGIKHIAFDIAKKTVSRFSHCRSQ
jgi:HTH-type transcriptional regulator, transcriptional repressor of NAD biosynthesis genes